MKYFKILLLLILCYSCDPQGEYIYMITNNSDIDLSISYKQWVEDDTTIAIPSNSEIVFYSEVGAGWTPVDEGEDFLNVFDTISLQIPDTLMLTKDFYKRDNWEYRRYGGGHMDEGTGEYNFIIENSELTSNE
jgi:hypothetical protein